LLDWIGGSFDPHAFRVEGIVVADPRKRLKIALEEE
jgi:hypothetical protein